MSQAGGNDAARRRLPAAEDTAAPRAPIAVHRPVRMTPTRPPEPAGSFLGLPPAEMTRPHVAQPPRIDGPASWVGPVDDEPAAPAPVAVKKKLSEPLIWMIEIVVWVVGALVLSTLLRIFVVQLFVVPSGSMEETLQINDRIAALKTAQMKRGDIVVFPDPGGWLSEAPAPVSPVHRMLEKVGLLASTDQQYLVKRVIGLPGDHVQCCTASGRLSVNGVAIDESAYLDEPGLPASQFAFDVVVPAGRIFVMGDNRNHSADSRYHICNDDAAGFGMGGFVPISRVVGPVRAVVMPFSRIGHRPTQPGLAAVPRAPGSPPDVATVSVTDGPAGSCHS